MEAHGCRDFPPDSIRGRLILRALQAAVADTPLPRKLPGELLAPWTYLESESRALHAKDRSSIYGGFHLYTRRPLC